MFARLTTRVPDQLKRVRQTGAEIKVQEDRASEARLAQMWAAEDRWREEQEDARARREQRERLIITLAISLIVVAIVAMIIIAVVTGSSTSAPLPPLSSAIYASGATLPGMPQSTLLTLAFLAPIMVSVIR